MSQANQVQLGKKIPRKSDLPSRGELERKPLEACARARSVAFNKELPLKVQAVYFSFHNGIYAVIPESQEGVFKKDLAHRIADGDISKMELLDGWSPTTAFPQLKEGTQSYWVDSASSYYELFRSRFSSQDRKQIYPDPSTLGRESLPIRT
ncbi:hypothetical protein [Acetomicrobium sp. S15 = DSM 107314]|uniref:hypothetical protein n=1 Tax=Acetomicrobium sp. S15 = DSM 107314 TaxID=2529858 RepID=UPI0018E0F891|nr:hypothetical protein [Acetomicrobium sp. S15 = DSM 107314]